MPALKRPANSGVAARRPKRPRAQPRPAAPKPTSALRSVQSIPTRDVIYISSSSDRGSQDEDDDDDDQKPSGGIRPTDDFQDVVIHSVERPPPRPGARVGINYYRYLASLPTARYENVSVDFDAYRNEPPPNAPPEQPLPALPPQNLDLGPRSAAVDYERYPPHYIQYPDPIYKATTYNPLIALAILRIAQKNINFMDFSPNLEHLPNVGPTAQIPRFPSAQQGYYMPFLDRATQWRAGEDDQVITVLFLPDYHFDGRHALGFYTRKYPSGRLCALLFTPCTLDELKRAGLVRPLDPALSMAHITDIGGDDGDCEWDEVEVGVGGGEWLYRGLGEDQARWEAAEKIAGGEWMLRVRITLRTVSEGCVEAMGRDRGTWMEDWHD